MKKNYLLKKIFGIVSPLIPKKIKQLIPGRLKYFLRDKLNPRTIIIDVIGGCNLKCPSCPNGYFKAKNPGGMMDLETFKKILEKASREYPGAIIALYNWTEPFLHPQIAEFIKTVHSFGFKSILSSNLNLLPFDLDEFSKAGLGSLTISLSGFSQKIYEIGHRGGNIETVKENMRKLSLALKKAGASTKITVYYHKYLYNLEEIDLMKNFAESLGFAFGHDWAYFMPIEGIKDYLDDKLAQSEVDFIEKKLALDIRQAVEATKPFRKEPCLFPTSLLTIDWRGQIQLCCGLYDSGKFSIGSYLDTASEIIEERLKKHPYCKECMKIGLHILISWHGHKIRPIYEKIAEEKVKKSR